MIHTGAFMHTVRLTLFLLIAPIVLAAKGGSLTFSPAAPKSSTPLHFSYRASDADANARTVTVYAYCFSMRAQPVLVEIPLKKSGDEWKSATALALDTVTYIASKVLVDSVEDDNKGAWWKTRVFGVADKPVAGSRLGEVQAMSMMRMNFNDAGVRSSVYTLLSEEASLHPATPIWTIRWQLKMMEGGRGWMESTAPTIERELDSLAWKSTNESDLIDYAMWYERLGNVTKSDSLLRHTATMYKSKRARVRMEIRPLRSMADMDLVKTALASIITTYPETPEADQLKLSLVQIAMQQKKYDEAASFVSDYSIRNADLLPQLARMMLNDSSDAKRALDIAERGVAAARANEKPTYVSTKEWKSTHALSIATALGMQARALVRAGRADDAVDMFKESLATADNNDPELMFEYVRCLVAADRQKDALPVYEKILASMPATDEITDGYKRAYIKVNGSMDGFDAKLKQFSKSAFAAKYDELKQAMKNKAMKNFTISDLAGKNVELEKLKGKVVVLDFWAIWCGPCKQSFPFLQKVHDKYKDASDVVIYAVNTFERSSGDARKKAVEKFINDNKYTMPVLLDDDVAATNGITSIPTQFIIDKQGMLQFVGVGFEGPQMVETLSQKIEVLRSEEFYQQ